MFFKAIKVLTFMCMQYYTIKEMSSIIQKISAHLTSLLSHKRHNKSITISFPQTVVLT